MSKYDPLFDHLSTRGHNLVPMTFGEIEQVLGFVLPASSRDHRAWWSNNPSNNVMTKAWMSAGYETEDVDMGSERLVFHRTKQGSPSGLISGAEKGPKNHPLFGALRGRARIAEGHDLCAPADPDWGGR